MSHPDPCFDPDNTLEDDMATWILDDYGYGHVVSGKPAVPAVPADCDCEEGEMPPPTEEELKADYDRQWLDCIGADSL
jgi:hypothetical protein